MNKQVPSRQSKQTKKAPGSVTPSKAIQKEKYEKASKSKQIEKKKNVLTANRAAPVASSQRRSGLPKGRVVQGLKMPRGDKSDVIARRLKKKSPWYNSLEDPLHNADVKIPDSTGFETGTLQLVHRDTIVISGTAGACDGFRVICPLPNKSGGLPSCWNWQYTAAGSTTSSVSWPAISTASAFETSAALEAYSDGVRLVSGSITCQSEASLATNSGLITGYINPYPDAPFASGSPLTTYSNHFKTGIVPINNNQPCMVRYLPVKQNGGMYDMFYEPTNSVGPASATEVTVPFYEMGILISGAPADASFLVTVVMNYEFLPVENAINILDAKPSPVDAQEVDLVENWVQDMNVVSMTTTAAASSPPSSSTIQEPGQGTGFGMFAETVMELLPTLLPLLM